MNKLRDGELEKIVAAAADLFLRKSIGKTSVREIASASGCGEASVYRYYKTKDNLAIKAAAMLSDRIFGEYFTHGETTDGYGKIEMFYAAYERIYSENPGYYRFLYELDSSCMKSYSVTDGEYEKSVERYHELFLSAYREGVEDGSVSEISDIELFYYSSAHSLLNLCKFLSVSETPFAKDKEIKPEAEIRALCGMILNNIKIKERKSEKGI